MQVKVGSSILLGKTRWVVRSHTKTTQTYVLQVSPEHFQKTELYKSTTKWLKPPVVDSAVGKGDVVVHYRDSLHIKPVVAGGPEFLIIVLEETIKKESADDEQRNEGFTTPSGQAEVQRG